MSTTLEILIELEKLKRAVGRQDKDTTSELEAEFLRYSSSSPPQALTVRLPKSYPLQGEQASRVMASLDYLGVTPAAPPSALDISGNFNYGDYASSASAALQDVLVFASPEQMNADHFTSLRSYLNPLLEKIYTEGAALLRDFTLQEAVAGRAHCWRADLDLNEITLFPEKFKPGPYRASVQLDTPSLMVRRLGTFYDYLRLLSKEPKEFLLESTAVQELAVKGVELRRLVGSLSRYDVPEHQEFTAEVPSAIVRTDKNTLFYLYSPEQNGNVLVYFGETPFQPLHEPQELLLLSGKGHQHVLRELLEVGIYDISEAVLQKRIGDLTTVMQGAARKTMRPLQESHLSKLLAELHKVQTYFKEVVNPEQRRKYVQNAKNIAPELLEFMLCPAQDDPVVHELLPRLSWNRVVRTYHNTGKFLFLFQEANEARKKAMVKEITDNLLFRNQQNNDVNVWLYQNHRDWCREAGVLFEVRE